MREPVVIDYKDQSPIHATLTNAAIFRDGRLVGDGPAAANIPGVVAGMDHLHRRYGSGRFSWAQLIAPAITLASEGYELDEALPSTIREGRAMLERWPEAARQPDREDDRERLEHLDPHRHCGRRHREYEAHHPCVRSKTAAV